MSMGRETDSETELKTDRKREKEKEAVEKRKGELRRHAMDADKVDEPIINSNLSYESERRNAIKSTTNIRQKETK